MNQLSPILRGFVVTTAQEGQGVCAYINITFVVPVVTAVNVDLAQALEDLTTLVRENKIKERPVALRREFIQPV